MTMDLTKEQAINIVRWRTKGDGDDDDDECGLTWRGISRIDDQGVVDGKGIGVEVKDHRLYE